MIEYTGPYSLENGTISSAGYDLRVERVADRSKCTIRAYFGIHLNMEPHKGIYAQLQPRSSISKYGLLALTTPGIIDNDYTGELVQDYFMYDPSLLTRKEIVGKKIAQLTFHVEPFGPDALSRVNTLSTTTERGSHGSTGD